ncbi:MAG: hypothetical protein QG646_2621, partial [Euryarchaeota archaeon]|nr:hypothetical protein [Euryarchaeota archaeon]
MITILLLLLVFVLLLIILALVGYALLTAPFAVPYLITKFKNGILLILKTDTGRYVFTPLNKNYHS